MRWEGYEGAECERVSRKMQVVSKLLRRAIRVSERERVPNVRECRDEIERG